MDLIRVVAILRLIAGDALGQSCCKVHTPFRWILLSRSDVLSARALSDWVWSPQTKGFGGMRVEKRVLKVFAVAKMEHSHAFAFWGNSHSQNP